MSKTEKEVMKKSEADVAVLITAAVVFLSVGLFLISLTGGRRSLDLFLMLAPLAGLAAAAWAASYWSVRATDLGLAWWDLKGRHTAAWEEVSDFYDLARTERISGSSVLRTSEVVLRDGRRIRFADLAPHFGRFGSLRRKIAERATQAAAAQGTDGIRGWQVQGTRPADLPRAFSYDPAVLAEERKRFLRTSVPLHLIWLMWLLEAFIRGNDEFHGAWPFWFLAMMVGFPVASLGLLARGWWQAEKARRDALARNARGERFEARVDGLVYSSEGESRFIRWEAVVGYDFVRGPDYSNGLQPAPTCRVRTADGREFTFTNRLADFGLFKAVLRQYASEGIEARVDSDERNALGGVAARWSGGVEGKGDRVYHARTRSNRRWGALFGLYACLGLVQLAFWVVDPPPHLWGFLTLNLAFILSIPFAASAAVSYWTDRLILSKDGITRQIGRRRQPIPWNAMDEVENDGDRLKLIGADGRTLLAITPDRYAYGSEIADRIEQGLHYYRHRAAQGDVADVLPAVTTPAQPLGETETPVVLVRRIE